jgi:hypothetical protein
MYVVLPGGAGFFRLGILVCNGRHVIIVLDRGLETVNVGSTSYTTHLLYWLFMSPF